MVSLQAQVVVSGQFQAGFMLVSVVSARLASRGFAPLLFAFWTLKMRLQNGPKPPKPELLLALKRLVNMLVSAFGPRLPGQARSDFTRPYGQRQLPIPWAWP
jgi:hypothetical protein